MVKRLLDGPWEQIKKRFPDRQIYHRTEGQVRYFAVTTEMQLAVIGLVCVLVVWLTATSVGIVINNGNHQRQIDQLAAQEDRIREQLEEARASEAAAISYVESRTNAFDRTAGEFQLRHDTLRRLLDFADDLSIGEGSQSPSIQGGRILMAAQNDDPDPRIALFDNGEAQSGDGLAEERVAALVSDQDAALAQAEDSAQRRLENLRAVLRLTGMQVEDALDHGALDSEGGTGGPLVSILEAPLFASGLDLADPFNSRVARIAATLVESEQLDLLMNAAPMGPPVAGTLRRTSPYGQRIDPFTRRLAMHAGQDFGAYRNAPIIAPSSGRVVYAGWRAGYGRTVEIDHGFGFRTRFAHLHTVDVRRGDMVELGQRIGGMGSTGRSTATHLHYEIWFQGNHVDPNPYIRAGQYVH